MVTNSQKSQSKSETLTLLSLFLFSVTVAVIFFLSENVLQAQLTPAQISAIAARNQQIYQQRLRESAERRAIKAAQKKANPPKGQQPDRQVIPADIILNVLNEIKPEKNGWSPSPFCGWNVTDLDNFDSITLNAIVDKSKKTAKVLNIQLAKGYYVNCVDPDSNAASAGLCRGDIIVFFNNKKYDVYTDYKKWLENNKPKELELTIYKNSEDYKESSKITVKPDVLENTEIIGNKIIITSEEIESLDVLETNIEKEKDALATRFKNIKTEPFFEGSSVKKVLNAKEIFITKKFLYTTDGDIDDDVIPESYEIRTEWKIPSQEMHNGGIEYDLTMLKNVLMNGNTLIQLNDERLDRIKKIVKNTSDTKGRDLDLCILLESKVEISASGLKYIKEVLSLITDPVEQDTVRRQLLDGVVVINGEKIKNIKEFLSLVTDAEKRDSYLATLLKSNVVINDEKIKSIKEFLPLITDAKERDSKLRRFLEGKFEINDEKIKRTKTILSQIGGTQEKETVLQYLINNDVQFGGGYTALAVKCFGDSPEFELRTDIDTEKKTIKCELFAEDAQSFGTLGFIDKEGTRRKVKFDLPLAKASMPVDAEMFAFIAKEKNKFALDSRERTIRPEENVKIKELLDIYNIFIKYNFKEKAD